MKATNRFLVHFMVAAKVTAALLVVGLFFTFVLQYSPLSNVSPDSIRFMHFWQINADQLSGKGVSPANASKAVYYSLRSSNNYDASRGRIVQALAYGVDGLTRWMLPSPVINAWVILVMIANSALIAWVSTKSVRNSSDHLNLALLCALVIVSTSFTISPVMLLILYGKYIWFTFVLCHFAARRTTLKVAWLTLAAFSDEIGLFATMALTFFAAVRIALIHKEMFFPAHSGRSPNALVLKACVLGVAASFTLLFSFYGVSAVLFGGTKPDFLGFAAAATGGAQLFDPGTFSSLFLGLLWRAEILVVGMSFGRPILTTFIGLAVFAVIAAQLWRVGKTIAIAAPRHATLDVKVLAWLSNDIWRFYAFWLLMLFSIAFVVIRVGAGDYSHYGYPAAAVLSVLFIRSLIDILPARPVTWILLAMLSLHLAQLPKAIEITYDFLDKYLFPDRTVSLDDIRGIQRSVMEFKRNGVSPFFDKFTNGREIDFTGTWFYSRVRSAESVTEPHFPIQGTVRVLLWPTRINSPFFNKDRVFDYKRPQFSDQKHFNLSKERANEHNAPPIACDRRKDRVCADAAP